MSTLFWGLVITMSAAAISFVAIPLKARKLLPGAAATLVAVALPLFAFALYFLIGSPGQVSAAAPTAQVQSNYGHAPPSKRQPAGSIGSVASLVDGLSARLQDEPEDAGGWLLLARSYEHLGRNAEAIAAYKRALSLGKTDVAFEASLLGAAIAAAPVAPIPGPAARGREELSVNE